jgi:hypothetical protein
MGWARRIGQALVAIALAVNAAPRATASHCRATPTETGHHHRHDVKDTDGAGQCPHCPPVECRRHDDCGATADLGVTPARDGSARPVGGLIVSSLAPAFRSAVFQPPTPPPLAALVLG